MPDQVTPAPAPPIAPATLHWLEIVGFVLVAVTCCTMAIIAELQGKDPVQVLTPIGLLVLKGINLTRSLTARQASQE